MSTHARVPEHQLHLNSSNDSDVEQPTRSSKLAPGMEQMVQHLLQNGLTAIPKRFIQPLEKRVSQSQRKGDNELQLPLVDLSRMEDDQGREYVVSEISRACTEWGFVQVVNHGVPPELMDAAMDYSRMFFALPAEVKAEYRVGKIVGSGHGYGRLFENDERVIADWNDGLVVSSYNKRIDTLPKLTHPPGFQEVVDEYGRALQQLHRKILGLLSEAVGQPSEFFYSKIGGDKSSGDSSLKFYPPCPEPELVLGLSAHEDGGSVLTFVQQSEVPGLEVLKDGEWIVVQPVPHAIVVNVGDILQMISNGRFRSVQHRVFPTHAPAGRLSIATFNKPTRDTIVQPAPELCSETQPPLYRPVKYHDCQVEFFTRKNLGPGFIKRYELK